MGGVILRWRRVRSAQRASAASRLAASPALARSPARPAGCLSRSALTMVRRRSPPPEQWPPSADLADVRCGDNAVPDGIGPLVGPEGAVGLLRDQPGGHHVAADGHNDQCVPGRAGEALREGRVAGRTVPPAETPCPAVVVPVDRREVRPDRRGGPGRAPGWPGRPGLAGLAGLAGRAGLPGLAALVRWP